VQAFSSIFEARKTQVIRAGEMGVGRHQAAIAAVRQFLRPSVLAILALAFVVGACGYGFKLHQYQHLFQLSRPCAVRMWIEHRDDSSNAFAHHSLRPEKLPGTGFALSVAPARFAGWPRDYALVLSAPLRPAFLVSSLIPFRAPPISHSSLA
jgi:hypothetical protein